MTNFTEGWHRGRAVATGIGYTEGNTPQVAVMLRIADNDATDAGRTITTYLYLSDATAEKTMEALRVLGYKGNNLEELADESIDTELLLPNDVAFPINYEEYNGISRPKVGPIRRASSGSVALKNKLEGNEAKQFGLRFRSLCAAFPAGAEKKSAPKTRQADQPNPDAHTMAGAVNDDSRPDDFPF